MRDGVLGEGNWNWMVRDHKYRSKPDMRYLLEPRFGDAEFHDHPFLYCSTPSPRLPLRSFSLPSLQASLQSLSVKGSWIPDAAFSSPQVTNSSPFSRSPDTSSWSPFCLLIRGYLGWRVGTACLPSPYPTSADSLSAQIIWKNQNQEAYSGRALWTLGPLGNMVCTKAWNVYCSPKMPSTGGKSL